MLTSVKLLQLLTSNLLRKCPLLKHIFISRRTRYRAARALFGHRSRATLAPFGPSGTSRIRQIISDTPADFCPAPPSPPRCRREDIVTAMSQADIAARRAPPPVRGALLVARSLGPVPPGCIASSCLISGALGQRGRHVSDFRTLTHWAPGVCRALSNTHLGAPFQWLGTMSGKWSTHSPRELFLEMMVPQSMACMVNKHVRQGPDISVGEARTAPEALVGLLLALFGPFWPYLGLSPMLQNVAFGGPFNKVKHLQPGQRRINTEPNRAPGVFPATPGRLIP